MDPDGDPVNTMAVAPEADEHAVRARPVRWVLGAALLTVLLAGACARPAERDATATATTAPTTTAPTVTS